MGRILAITLSGAALTIGLLSAPTNRAHSDESYINEYFEIESSSIEQVLETFDVNGEVSPPLDDCRPPSMQSDAIPGVEDANSIIAIGEKVWKMIEAGRPVVSFKAPVVHALPYNAICWHQLENWKPP